MIDGKRVLAVIPARGGSKGIPRKNIHMLGGKPLLAWTIEAAQQSKYIDRVIVSSDDPEIIKVANTWGGETPFVRPVELARDDTPGVEPVLHAVAALQETYEYVVLLQPTSPLRLAEDIDGCIELCCHKDANSCVSLVETAKSPYWMYSLDSESRMRPFMGIDCKNTRRQDLAPVYVVNGAVYVAKRQWLVENKAVIDNETIGYIMPAERSVDIDTEFDMMFSEYVFSLRKDAKGRM